MEYASTYKSNNISTLYLVTPENEVFLLIQFASLMRTTSPC